MGPQAHILPGGRRLHLNHGPIDLIIGVEGDRDAAFRAAQERFATLLDELVLELPMLRARMTKTTPAPVHAVARRMHQAVRPHGQSFVTCMAAVAGAVADEVLASMAASADMDRAYVNNGGDIALHLTTGTEFNLAMRGHDGRDLGRLRVTAKDNARGIATSGRHGRSLTMGIADSVSVLAGTAAQADVAATLIANAVDLPGHPTIKRRPACEVDDDSDLGRNPVVVSCGQLASDDVHAALSHGLSEAMAFRARGLIADAGLFLQSSCKTTADKTFQLLSQEATYA